MRVQSAGRVIFMHPREGISGLVGTTRFILNSKVVTQQLVNVNLLVRCLNNLLEELFNTLVIRADDEELAEEVLAPFLNSFGNGM